MPLPSGTISFSQVQTEFGVNNPPAMSAAPIKMTEYYNVDNGVPQSGTISLSQFRGKSRYYEVSKTISANTGGYNIYSEVLTGWTTLPSGAKKDANVNITINPTVYVHYNPTAGLTGSLATSQPAQHSSWPAGSRIYITNNGLVVGQGGTGGNGGPGPAAGAGTAGSIGGTAFVNLGVTTFITNNGTFGGGGGGGGGAQGFIQTGPNPGKGPVPQTPTGGAGGGGGRGLPSAGGTGGAGTVTGNPGSAGTLTTTGAGGTSPLYAGGAGGDLGAAGATATGPAGAAGGSPGAYISGSPSTTWLVNGTRLGTAS